MKYQHNIPIHCSKSTELETSSSAQIVTIKHGYCLKYKYWAQKTPQQTRRFSGPTLLSIYLKHNWFHHIQQRQMSTNNCYVNLLADSTSLYSGRHWCSVCNIFSLWGYYFIFWQMLLSSSLPLRGDNPVRAQSSQLSFVSVSFSSVLRWRFCFDDRKAIYLLLLDIF